VSGSAYSLVLTQFILESASVERDMNGLTLELTVRARLAPAGWDSVEQTL
jgi:hypothetical protein